MGHAGEHIDYVGGSVRTRWLSVESLPPSQALKHCHAVNPTAANLMCTLLEGHQGPHVDATTTARCSWPRKAGERVLSYSTTFFRCSDKHPLEDNVFCGMRKDHQGPHRDTSWMMGGKVYEWSNPPIPPQPADNAGKGTAVLESQPSAGGTVLDQSLDTQPALGGEITLENEIGDTSDLLEWAKSKNPKLFKTRGRDVASDKCMSADRERHKLCAESWCDCPCHDEDDMIQAQRRKNGRSIWGICLGALLLFLN